MKMRARNKKEFTDNELSEKRERIRTTKKNENMEGKIKKKRN